MKNSSPIIPDKSGALSDKYFVTITLPPRYYKKQAKMQLPIIKQAVMKYCENFVREATGVYELTKKGNVHYHGIWNLREDLLMTHSQVALMFIDASKPFSRCDIQLVKHQQALEDYLAEDLTITSKVCGCDIKNITHKYNQLQRFKTQPDPLYHLIDQAKRDISNFIDYYPN